MALCTDLIPQTLPELVWGTRAWGWLQRSGLGQDSPQERWGPWSTVHSRTVPRVADGSQAGRRLRVERRAEKGQCGPIRRRRAWRWVGTQGPAQDGGTVSPRHLVPRGWGGLRGSASRQGCVCAECVYVPSLSRRPPSWPGPPAGRCGPGCPRGSGCGVCALGVWVWAWGVGASLSRSSEPGSPCSQDAAPAPGRVFQHRPGGLWAQSFSRRLLRKPCEPVFV